MDGQTPGRTAPPASPGLFFCFRGSDGVSEVKKVAIFRRKCQNYGHYPIAARMIWPYSIS
jgi:hypothetical protein